MLRPEELEVASDHSFPLVCLMLPLLLGSRGLIHEDSRQSRETLVMTETSEAFFHPRVDPTVMELPAVFFLKWILSIEADLDVLWMHMMPLAEK